MKKKPDPEVFGRLKAQGASYEAAMLEAGYSASIAKRGKAALSNKMKQAWARELAKQGKTLSELSDEFTTPESLERLAASRLMQNVIEGKDGGTASVKALAQLKRANGQIMNEEREEGRIIEIVLPPSVLREMENCPPVIEAVRPKLLGE